MTIDKPLLEDFLTRLIDRYSAATLVDILEDLGLVTVQDIIDNFSEQLMEAADHLE